MMKTALLFILLLLPFFRVTAQADSSLFNVGFDLNTEFDNNEIRLFERGVYYHTTWACGIKSQDSGTFKIRGNRIVTRSLKDGSKRKYRISTTGDTYCLKRRGWSMGFQKGRDFWSGRYEANYCQEVPEVTSER